MSGVVLIGQRDRGIGDASVVREELGVIGADQDGVEHAEVAIPAGIEQQLECVPSMGAIGIAEHGDPVGLPSGVVGEELDRREQVVRCRQVDPHGRPQPATPSTHAHHHQTVGRVEAE